MAYYPDLSPCDYFGSEHAAALRSVGWLEPGCAVPTGEVSEEVFDRLCDLLADPWQPCVTVGIHRCGFCRFTGGLAGVKSVSVGLSNLFVPGDGGIFVAPSMIVHYMDAHGYGPPAAFQKAVMECPPMRSAAYLRAVLANAGRGLALSRPTT